MNVVNFLEFKAKRIKMVKCKTQFIQCEDGTVYVPRPNGWMQGMARETIETKANHRLARLLENISER